MASIYLHIPFCRQACHYCDFHFSTSIKKKNQLVQALIKEISLRREELPREPLKAIYFGGGTPSLLNAMEMTALIQQLNTCFLVDSETEITLEANPDDITPSVLELWASLGINRLSLGIQSFRNDDLRLMNRAHTASQALNALEYALPIFPNLSIDLIYGIPNLATPDFEDNLEIIYKRSIPHVSCYALTVEPKTALDHYIKKELIPPIDEESTREQFYLAEAFFTDKGYKHYELSNFGLPGFQSVNNTAYWSREPYVGLGPSAHSFDGARKRSWNIANNSKYIESIFQNVLPSESESLSDRDCFNEFVMTGLRTETGVSTGTIARSLGTYYINYLKEVSTEWVAKGLLYWEDGNLKATKNGKFLTDGLAANLFLLNLQE